jgi:hypothetical protein
MLLGYLVAIEMALRMVVVVRGHIIEVVIVPLISARMEIVVAGVVPDFMALMAAPPVPVAAAVAIAAATIIGLMSMTTVRSANVDMHPAKSEVDALRLDLPFTAERQRHGRNDKNGS